MSLMNPLPPRHGAPINPAGSRMGLKRPDRHRPGTAGATPPAILFLFLSLLSASPAGDIAAPATLPTRLPGIVRQDGRVVLMENHSTALIAWHSAGISNATLIHIDAHDDCRWIADEPRNKLQELLNEKRYESIFSLSDIDEHFQYKVRQSEFLFDLGNFLYPCILNGTLTNVWWVIPNKTLSPDDSRRLQIHMQGALKTDRLEGLTSHGETGFSFLLHSVPFHVTTVSGLPEFPPGCLLDIDVDFFAFDRALTEQHIRGDMPWDPEETCRLFSSHVPDPSLITVCASVGGGYLPLVFRFLADAIFDHCAAGTHPEFSRELLSTVMSARKEPRPLPLPPTPGDPNYLPAWKHLGALFLLMKADIAGAHRDLSAAAALNPIYTKGFLDAAEALANMGRPSDALSMIESAEQSIGGPTTLSDAARTRVSMDLGQTNVADALSQKVMDWHRSPHSMMLRAGVLTEIGRFADAEALYREILAKDPQKQSVLYNMGLIREKQGNIDDAIRLYRSTLSVFPDFVNAHENLGHLLLQTNEINPAIFHMARAVELDPFRVISLNNLGLALIRIGRNQDAALLLERAVRINPNQPETHANLGMALANIGRRIEARKHYAKAIELRPGWTEVEEALHSLQQLMTNSH